MPPAAFGSDSWLLDFVALLLRNPIPTTVVGFALATLLAWRLLRFTILPAFYPDDPKELPYWIPCKLSPRRCKAPSDTADLHGTNHSGVLVVGHAYGFFRFPHGVLEKGR